MLGKLMTRIVRINMQQQHATRRRARCSTQVRLAQRAEPLKRKSVTQHGDAFLRRIIVAHCRRRAVYPCLLQYFEFARADPARYDRREHCERFDVERLRGQRGECRAEAETGQRH
jgi:hypothetical protein